MSGVSLGKSGKVGKVGNTPWRARSTDERYIPTFNLVVSWLLISCRPLGVRARSMYLPYTVLRSVTCHYSNSVLRTNEGRIL